jgi:hypothetical protein
MYSLLNELDDDDDADDDDDVEAMNEIDSYTCSCYVERFLSNRNVIASTVSMHNHVQLVRDQWNERSNRYCSMLIVVVPPPPPAAAVVVVVVPVVVLALVAVVVKSQSDTNHLDNRNHDLIYCLLNVPMHRFYE